MPSRSPDLLGETQSSWLLWRYTPALCLTHLTLLTAGIKGAKRKTEQYQESLTIARLRKTQGRVRINWAVNCGSSREDSSLMRWVIWKGSCTGGSILNFPQLRREGVSEGEKVAAVPWCQRPQLIIFELDFHAGLGERLFGQGKSSTRRK